MAAMSDDALVALLTPFAYLLGTFPSANLVARRKGVDVTAAGSGNPGASNTFRLLGWRAGALVFGLDAAKGAAAALVGLLVQGRAGALVLGIAAIVGHMLPVTRRFKGGRGVATAAGVLLVLYPLILVALVVVWAVVARVTHKASVASLVVAVAFPVAAALTGAAWWEVVVLAAVAALVVARHAANLRRLVRGEELGLDPGDSPPGAATPDDRDNA
jgi:acyl phosphate:glycerol-3-phosphate acyltransferase